MRIKTRMSPGALLLFYLKDKATYKALSTVGELLLMLAFSACFSTLAAQGPISVDAMDPRTKGETTSKAYTDDEVKWRVGYSVPTGGAKAPAITMTVSGKSSLCDGSFKFPPGWQAEVDNGSGGKTQAAQSSIEESTADTTEDEEEYDPTQLIDANEVLNDSTETIDCEDSQTITVKSIGWVSESPGSGTVLEQGQMQSFNIGRAGGDGYLPVIHGSNGRIYMTYHLVTTKDSALIQCIDVKLGAVCKGYPMKLKSGSGKSGVGNKYNKYPNTTATPYYTGLEHNSFVGDKYIYPVIRIRKDKKKYQYGLGCFDVNSNNPTQAGSCDGKNGRSLFGDKGFIRIGEYTYRTTYSILVGPFISDDKIYAYSILNANLYCFDATNGESCGTPYPLNFSKGKFTKFARSLPNPWSANAPYVPHVPEPGRGLMDDGRIYIAVAPGIKTGWNTAVNDFKSPVYMRCWDTVTQSFCWGDKTPKMPAYQSGWQYWYRISLTKRFGENGFMNGICSFLPSKSNTTKHSSENYVGCIESTSGDPFPKGSNASGFRYGFPLALAKSLKKNSKHGIFNGFTTPASVQHRVGPNIHGRTYFAGGFGTPSGVICWDWTANRHCYREGGDETSIEDDAVFGDDGHIHYSDFINGTQKTWDYGIKYDQNTGCLWSLGDYNVLWSFDANGGFPCKPSAFQASNIVDPSSFYCASGPPADWNWNTIEIYDINLDDWFKFSVKLYDIENGIVIKEFNNYSDANILKFARDGERYIVDLKNDLETRSLLSPFKRLKVIFNGIRFDADNIIASGKIPTIITTIDADKPIEFCLNAKTQSGATGCGGAYFSATTTTTDGNNFKTKSGVQVVEYSADPESHTQPALYVKQGAKSGFGLMVRPYLYPVLKQGSDIEVNGISTVQALFVTTYKNEDEDKLLNFVEDSNEDHSLDVNDKNITYVPNERNGMGVRIDYSETIEHANNVKPLWDAHSVLRELSESDTLIQRNYDSVNNYRYVFTWLDTDVDNPIHASSNNGIVEEHEVVSFIPEIVNDYTKGLFKDISGNRPSLSSDKAKAIIRFMRGDSRVTPDEETLTEDMLDSNPELSIVGFRNRRIIPPVSSIQETFRLGGLRHSKPLIVGVPGDSKLSTRYNADNEYVISWAEQNNLDDYLKFRDLYNNRRTMVYIGGNDGMIHAFNSGFINFEQESVKRLPDQGLGMSDRPLGQEVWSYVPRAVLPFLNFLTNPQYEPTLYIDGNPAAFDVRAFDNDSTHPGGWGTLLVVPMRMGGGFAEVTLSDGSTGQIMPVYILLDITDPEQPPRLVGEIAHPDLGYAVSEPTIVYENEGDELVPYLVFGSGPTNPAFAVSDRVGNVFAYDIKNKLLEKRGDPLEYFDIEGNTIPNFVGDMKAVNLRNEFTGGNINAITELRVLTTDVVYFGITSGTDVRKLGGRIMRLNSNQSTNKLSKIETLLIPKNQLDDSDHPVGRPVLYAPSVSVSIEGKRDDLWIYAGTGRLLVDADESNIEQQYVMGIIERTNYDYDISNNYPISVGNADIPINKLVDITKVEIDENSALKNTDANLSGLNSGITNERQLAMRIVNDSDGDDVDGWLRLLNQRTTGLGDNEMVAQAGRITGSVTIINNQLIVPEFLPASKNIIDQCEPSGVQTFLKFNKDTGIAKNIVLTTFDVFDASVNDADYILWKDDLAIGSGSTTRLDEDTFYSLGNTATRIRWRQLEDF